MYVSVRYMKYNSMFLLYFSGVYSMLIVLEMLLLSLLARKFFRRASEGSAVYTVPDQVVLEPGASDNKKGTSPLLTQTPSKESPVEPIWVKNNNTNQSPKQNSKSKEENGVIQEVV